MSDAETHDPLAYATEGVDDAIDRANAMLKAKGLQHTTADVIALAKAILDRDAGFGSRRYFGFLTR
jgi:hypothetical protein